MFGGIYGEIVGAGQTEHTASGPAGEPQVFAGMLKERIQASLGKVEVSDIGILLHGRIVMTSRS